MKKFLWLLLLSCGVEAATIPASTCQQAAVATAITSASAGDTVTVPAGLSCNWTGGLSIAGISLIGAGKSATTGTVVTTGAVTMTKHATQLTRVSGFRFTGASQNHITWGGGAFDRPIIIDNNFLSVDAGNTNANRFIIAQSNGAVIHHNDFNAATGTGGDVFNIATGETNWSLPTSIGTEDATGERNIYFEDNVFTNILETMPDADTGTRLVMRHNTFVDSSIVLHSSAPNDSGPTGGGHRHTEIYNNVFSRVSNTNPLNKWIWWRGGFGVFANNVMDRASSPDGFSYPGKPDIRFSVGCLTAYPITYQVGQDIIPADSTPNRPVIIFGNTGSGSATDPNFIAKDTGPIVTCATPASYIVQGRDYVFSNTWGWVPFPYPHPLVSNTLPLPSNVRIVL